MEHCPPTSSLIRRLVAQKGPQHTCVSSFIVSSGPSDGPVTAPRATKTGSLELLWEPEGPGWGPYTLTLGGQVKADVPIIMHGAVELAVTGLTEVEGSPVVPLLAVSVVAYLAGKEGEEGQEGWAGPRRAPGRHSWGPDRCRAQVGFLVPPEAAHFSTLHSPRGPSCSLIHSVDVSQAPLCVHSEGSTQKSRSLPSKNKVCRGDFRGGTTRQLLPGPLPGVQEGRAPQNAQGCCLVRPARCWNWQTLTVCPPPRPSALSSVTCLAPESNLTWDEGGYGGVRERHWYLVLRQPHPPAPVFTVSWLRSPPSLGMTVIHSPSSVSHSSPLTHSAPHFPCCSPTLRGFTLLQSSRPPSESGRAARAWSRSTLALTYPIIPLSFSTSSCHTLSLIPFQQNPMKQQSILTTSSSSLPVLISIFSLTFHF